MTINVAVKCPDGIVLGADSLVSIMPAGGNPTAFAPYHRKLFQIADLPAGVLLNGQTAINGQTVDDILAEFGASLTREWKASSYTLTKLSQRLRDFVKRKIGSGAPPDLQLIVGGFSRGKSSIRYGELFTLTWPEGRMDELYQGDKTFGAYFGGRPDPIYRFLFGFDRLTARNFILQWKPLFETTRDYIVREIESAGCPVPTEVKEMDVPSFRQIHPWCLLSTYDVASSPDDLKVPDMLTLVTESSRLPYTPAYGFFSLRMAVDFAWHMLLLPYAESNFMNQLPLVGSELRIATITRDEGFKRAWRGLPGVPQEL